MRFLKNGIFRFSILCLSSASGLAGMLDFDYHASAAGQALRYGKCGPFTDCGIVKSKLSPTQYLVIINGNNVTSAKQLKSYYLVYAAETAVASQAAYFKVTEPKFELNCEADNVNGLEFAPTLSAKIVFSSVPGPGLMVASDYARANKPALLADEPAEEKQSAYSAGFAECKARAEAEKNQTKQFLKGIFGAKR
jgi:hypothetical protein